MRHIFLHGILMRVLLAQSFEQIDHIPNILPGDPKSMKLTNCTKYVVQKSSGVIFQKTKAPLEST